MTQPADWLELWLADSERLRELSWDVNEFGRIRSVDGWCPLCAWAHLIEPASNYRLSWVWALRTAFKIEAASGAGDLADAIDCSNMNPTKSFMRAVFLTTLQPRMPNGYSNVWDTKPRVG